jgi:hypothetical protein
MPTETLKDQALLERIAAQAAERAVKDTLTQLGIDHTQPLEAQRDFLALREMRQLITDNQFQADLMHLRNWRKTMEGVKSKGSLTFIGLAVTGIMAALWIGFKEMVTGAGG